MIKYRACFGGWVTTIEKCEIVRETEKSVWPAGQHYHALTSDGDTISAPALNDIPPWLDSLPDPAATCSIYDPRDKRIYHGSVTEVRQQLHEYLFPSPATRADIQRLERQIQELKLAMKDMATAIIGPHVTTKTYENGKLISIEYVKM